MHRSFCSFGRWIRGGRPSRRVVRAAFHGVESLELRLCPSTISVNAGTVVNTASSDIAGVNFPDYSPLLNDPQTLSLVRAAGLKLIRESPGTNADLFHFYLAPGSSPLAFQSDSAAALALAAEAAGAGNTLVNVNYGTGTPAEAAAYVAYLNGSPASSVVLNFPNAPGAAAGVSKLHTAGDWASLRGTAPLAIDDGLNFLRINHPAPFGVKYFEVGNEVYFDVNNSEGFTNPVYHNQPADPPTGQAYIQFAKSFTQLAQQIDPAISVGIDVGSSDENDAASGGFGSLWTAPMLQQAAAQSFVPGFLSDHLYVFSSAPSGSGGENDSALLHSVSAPNAYFNNLEAPYLGPRDWATRAAQYRADLTAAFGAAGNGVALLATEWNSDAGSSKILTNLVAGLFVADSIGSLLQTEYAGATFWDLRNAYTPPSQDPPNLYGWRTNGDTGLLGDPNFNSPPQSAAFVPYPTYFGFQLWAQILQGGDKVVSAGSDDAANLGVYALLKQNGHLGVVVINKSAGSDLTEQFNITGFTPSGSATSWQYGEANDNAQAVSPTGAAQLTQASQNFILTQAAGQSSFSVQFPRYSMTAFDLAPAGTTGTTSVHDVFVTGFDGQMYFEPIGATGQSGGYRLVAPGQVQSFVAATDGANHPELFVLGGDHQVYGLKFDANNNPGAYFLAAAGAIQSFTVGHDGNNHPEVFAVGLDSQVYTIPFDATGTPAGGYALTATGQIKSLVVGSDSKNNPLLFATGLDNQVYEMKFNVAGMPVGGYTLTAVGAVKSIDFGHDAANHLQLFVIGMDSRMYAQKFDGSGTAISGYFPAGAGAFKSLSAASTPQGNLQLFGVGFDDQVYTQVYDTSANPVGGFALAATGEIKSMVVGRIAPESAALFAVGFDNQVYRLLLGSSGNPLGGFALTAPGAVQSVGTAR